MRKISCWTALGVLLAASGCGLKDVQIPDYTGPSELALSLKLTASPDILGADGFSTSSVQATLRGPDGQPLAGRDITFVLTDDFGRFADIGRLSADRGTTNGAGIVQVIYTAPYRTDNTANRSILVQARPILDDANGQFFYRNVRIELRSPETRQFPQAPDDDPPHCDFLIEPGIGGVFPGNQILFRSTSYDADGFIIRYEWDFGDGTKDDKPDVNHAYGFSGQFLVVHVVTDNVGLQDACAASVFVP